MTANRTAIGPLTEQLAAELREAYDTTAGRPASGGQPLREAFARFGQAAAANDMSLEDASSAAVEALQELFGRIGARATAPGTLRGAGIAVAALARAYLQPTPDAAPNHTEPALPTQLVRLAALHRINRAVTANLELGDVLETTVRLVAETMASDACAVFLYDAATETLVLRAAVGLNAAAVGALTLRPGMGITGRAASEGRIIAAPDAHAHEAFLTHPIMGDDVYTSQVSVPMLQGTDRLVGVLNILTVARRDFDEDEIAFLRTVAGELAISIENARLYSRTDARLRRKIAELGMLQRVSRTIASTLDPVDVLRLITEQAVELVRAEAAAIFRAPPDEVRGARGDGWGPTVAYRVGTARDLIDEADRDELVRQVVRSGASWASELAFVDGSSRVHCLPLSSARETLGALCVRLRPGAELSEDQLGLLQAFTDSASLAIENAELYQDARYGFDTASALLQEMHHRVRNNLQTVAALLSLQLRQAEDAPWAVEVREAVSRIQAIAAVHDLLSDDRHLGDATVDVIARYVAEEAHTTLIPPGLKVEFEIAPSDLKVRSRQATVLALLINELVSNAVSHGFEGRTHGMIAIQADRDDGVARIQVTNDGIGVPEGFDPAQSPGLGMRIVQRLVTSDLRGEFEIRSTDAETVATITFPLDDRAQDTAD